MEIIKRDRLGTEIATYRKHPRRRGDIFMVLSGMLITITIFCIGLYRAQEGYTHYGPVAAYEWSWPWFSFSTFSFLLTLSSILLVISRYRFSIYFHENGLQIIRFLRPPYILRWNQVSGIKFTQECSENTSRFLKRQAIIYPFTGKPIHFTDSIMGLTELITLIKAHLYPNILPKLRSQFQDGHEVHFGPITIHRQYLKIQRGPLPFFVLRKPWSHILHITVKTGFLIVDSKKGKLISIPVSKIPNLELLLNLIQTGVYVQV